MCVCVCAGGGGGGGGVNIYTYNLNIMHYTMYYVQGLRHDLPGKTFAKVRANALQKIFARFIFGQPGLGEIHSNLSLRNLHSQQGSLAKRSISVRCKSGRVVGYLPKKLPRIYSLFIRRGGVIRGK